MTIAIREALNKSPNGSIHFPFVLSAAPSAAYRRSKRKILTTNGLVQGFLSTTREKRIKAVAGKIGKTPVCKGGKHG